MIENIVKQFLDFPCENNAFNLIRHLRCSDFHNTAVIVGKYLSNIYPYNINIRSECAISAYYSYKYQLSYDLYSKNLENKNLDENDSYFLKINRHFSVPYILDNYIDYNPDIIKTIMTKPATIPMVTFTITTCKRFDLFEKTMNSFLNCCKDIKKIDYWLCVDDNSSTEDRKKMKDRYPFFTFYWKTIEEKGHPKSMNIIRNLVKTYFILHMEDDWKFFERKNYISECIEVLESNDKIGQCLINKNYAEVINDIHIVGGLFNKTQSGLRFFTHEYSPDEKSYIDFNNKYKNGINCSYWPHFSFRPSVLKKSMLDKIGSYNENISHFEMDYSRRYVNMGFVSTFLECIYCVHIGRLTSQINDKTIKNSYDLNNEMQFSGKEELKVVEKKTINNIKTYVINLDRRPDRFKTFSSISPINYIRYPAIDGKLLKPNKHLQRIFEGNDYNMRVGLVGCAMSHIKLLIELVNNEDSTDCDDNNQSLFIMEDDVKFVPDFINKFNDVINQLKNIDWDFIYLGNSLYTNHRTDDYYDKKANIILEKWSSELSIHKSMGGFFAYLINKKGARKFLDFINNTGMTNGIDTMQQKAINKAPMNTFYCFPHLVYSECVLNNNNINSDIQYSFESLSLTDKEIHNLCNSYESLDRLKKNGKFNIDDAISLC